MPDGRHHGKGEHDKRNVTMPTMPGLGFVVIEPKLVLGGLETVLNCPTMTLNPNQRLDRCSGRTPSGEVGEIAIGDMALDEKSARPQAMVFVVELFGFEISQFEITPVM